VPVSLFLLGSFGVERDGKPIAAFESHKVRALLAFLAVEAGRPHQRSALAGLLWPDHPEELARTNLRHVLRQTMASPADAPPFCSPANRRFSLIQPASYGSI
jgi:DNA-binding SARP family transcriptional activator